MVNPLADELSTEAKAELAAIFAALKREYPPTREHRPQQPRQRRFWEHT